MDYVSSQKGTLWPGRSGSWLILIKLNGEYKRILDHEIIILGYQYSILTYDKKSQQTADKALPDMLISPWKYIPHIHNVYPYYILHH